ncbi:MAG: hypothetical protein ACKOYG_11780 [Ilumatobacteraceae bacterium]
MRRVRRMWASLALAAVAAVGALSMAAPAAAGTYPPPPDDVVIEWPTNDDGAGFIEPGQSFTAIICCFAPGSEVYITIDTGTAAISSQALITLGPFIVAADGTVAVDFPPLPAGTFDMVLTIDGVSYRLPLIVGAVIPAAGSDSLSLLRPAIALVLTGAVIVLVAQRRRATVTAAAGDAPVTASVD